MIEYLKFFFSPGHIFSLRPQAMHNKALIILVILFLLFIAFGIISLLTSKKINDGLKVKAWNQLWHLGMTMGILGLVYLFFAWQGVALLASRFWLIIWLITTLIWLGFIGKYLFLKAPKLRKEIEEDRDPLEI